MNSTSCIVDVLFQMGLLIFLLSPTIGIAIAWFVGDTATVKAGLVFVLLYYGMEAFFFGSTIGDVLVIVGPIIGLAATLRAFQESHRQPGCCQTCGYDLTGNIAGRCPECGTQIPEEKKKKLAKERRA